VAALGKDQALAGPRAGTRRGARRRRGAGQLGQEQTSTFDQSTGERKTIDFDSQSAGAALPPPSPWRRSAPRPGDPVLLPVAVGGPITKIVDQMAADFEKENPASR
jgi:hypothetical protein